MTTCIFCGAPTFGYVDGYLDRRKTGSYPACLNNFAMALVYEKFGQDWLRDTLASILPIRKGSLPRLKVSFPQ